MTNHEINIKIVEIEGLEIVSKQYLPANTPEDVLYVWSFTELQPSAFICDFINDWNLLGPLVVKMGYHGWVYYFDLLHKWKLSSVIIVEDHSFGKATCLAYIKEFGNET